MVEWVKTLGTLGMELMEIMYGINVVMHARRTWILRGWWWILWTYSILLKCILWNPNLQSDYIWGLGFQKVIKVKWGYKERILIWYDWWPYRKANLSSSLSTHIHWGKAMSAQSKKVVIHTGKRDLSRNGSCWTLILDFSTFQQLWED